MIAEIPRKVFNIWDDGNQIIGFTTHHNVGAYIARDVSMCMCSCVLLLILDGFLKQVGYSLQGIFGCFRIYGYLAVINISYHQDQRYKWVFLWFRINSAPAAINDNFFILLYSQTPFPLAKSTILIACVWLCRLSCLLIVFIMEPIIELLPFLCGNF